MKPNLLSLLILSTVVLNLSAATDKKIEFALQDVNTSYMDVTDIYFGIGVASNYVSVEDSKKVIDPSWIRPQLYSFTSDGVPCYSNGFGDLSKATVIGVGFRAAGGGTYVLSLTSIDVNIDGTTVVLLEDKQTGALIDLRQEGDTFNIAVNEQTDNRFFLHLSFPATVTSVPSGCANDDGIVTVNVDPSIQWSSVLLFDTTGHLVQKQDNVATSIDFSALQGGFYRVAFAYGSYTTVKDIELQSHHIQLSINASVTNASVEQNIQFYSHATNTSEYVWQFGDSTIIAGVQNPEYFYYEPGNYTVSLQASNSYECRADATMNISIGAQTATSVSAVTGDNIHVFADKMNVVITADNISGASYFYEIYNLSGQLLTTNSITSPYSAINLSNESAGIYLVVIKNSTGSRTHKLFLD